MKWHSLHTVAVAVLLLAIQGLAFAQELPDQSKVHTMADEILREMGKLMSGSPELSIRINDSIDNVLSNGQKVQCTHVREITFVRPNLLKVEASGDVVNRIVWKDDKMVSVYDPGRNKFARFGATGSVEQVSDLLQDRLGISLPGSDLLADDIYKLVTDNAVRIEYYGLGYVGENKCHHIVCQGNEIDWQLWIDSGEQKWPRKLVITYKNEPAQPQYTMHVVSIEVPQKVDPQTFKYDIPADAEQVEVQFVR